MELARLHIEDKVREDPFFGRMYLFELRKICAEGIDISKTGTGRRFPSLTLADCRVLLGTLGSMSEDIERRCAESAAQPQSEAEASGRVLLFAREFFGGRATVLTKVGDGEYVQIDGAGNEGNGDN